MGDAGLSHPNALGMLFLRRSRSGDAAANHPNALDMSSYEGPGVVGASEWSGVALLRSELTELFPGVTWQRGFNPRCTRGHKAHRGWKTCIFGHKISHHAESRALDGMTRNARTHQTITEWCLGAPGQSWDVQEVITGFSPQGGPGRWQRGRGWRRYVGASDHTDHVHLSLGFVGARRSRQPIAPVAVPVPVPAPKPAPVAVPVPAVPEFVYEEDAVITRLCTVTHQGFGLFEGEWDPGLGRDPIIVGAVQHGPYVAADGWWAEQMLTSLRAQPRGGKVVLTAARSPFVEAGSIPVGAERQIWVSVA